MIFHITQKITNKRNKDKENKKGENNNMNGLENREKLVESFNEILQVLDKKLIYILFENNDLKGKLKGKEDKFLYIQYTDIDEFTLYYDDEFGDGLNVELFKLDIEDILFKGIIVSLMGALADEGVLADKMEKETLEAISKLVGLVNIELDGLLIGLRLNHKKQVVN